MISISEKEVSNGQVATGEIYSALVQLVIHAESITWNRFYNYLTGNSILVLAWATIFSSDQRRILRSLVMVGICLLGGLSGLAWAGLGKRGRAFLNKFVDLSAGLENDSTCWPQAQMQRKPLSIAREMREDLGYKRFGSYYLLTWGPRLFSVLYLLLLIASMFECL